MAGKLGEGGMGQIYRAPDDGLDRDVAIKVLPEDAGLNDLESAFAALEQGLQDRAPRMVFVTVDPPLRTLRNDSRFARIGSGQIGGLPLTIDPAGRPLLVTIGDTLQIGTNGNTP